MGAEPDADALVVLVRRSHAGDAGSLRELRERLPALVDFAALEATARDAREAWADVVAEGNAAGRAERLRALDEATDRLARPGSGQLERLLARREALAAARVNDLWEMIAGSAVGPESALDRRDLVGRLRRAEKEQDAARRTLKAYQERVSAAG